MSVEMLNVKNYGSERVWSKKHNRDSFEHWRKDNVTMIRDVHKRTAEKLARAGITLVMHWKYLDNTNETMVGSSEGIKPDGTNGLTVA
eukprot:2094489-Ditylum_brightwellii.AAC.1